MLMLRLWGRYDGKPDLARQVRSEEERHLCGRRVSGTGLLLATAGPGILAIAGATGAGYLTWKWFTFRAKRGMRF